MKTIRIIIGISCVLTALAAVGRLVLGYTEDVFSVFILVVWVGIAMASLNKCIKSQEEDEDANQ